MSAGTTGTVRAFTPAGVDPKPGELLELDDDESRYLLKVRRVRVGQAVEILDGRGRAWTATLRERERRARVELGPAIDHGPPPDPRVILLGLPEPSATLDALTGASELGATSIILVRCERSQGHTPSAPRIERVLRAAVRQCGRPSAPSILGGPPDQPWSLARALAHAPELPGWFGQPAAPGALTPSPTKGGLRLLVGPEGGLSEAEVEAARAAGFVGVGLGPWILRTPTAVVAMLARCS